MTAAPRRAVSEWGSQPVDGTPFHILNTLRYNPFAQRYEALCHSEKGMRWAPVSFGGNVPSKWLRQVPLPYEVPTSFAFTLTYTCEPRRPTSQSEGTPSA